MCVSVPETQGEMVEVLFILQGVVALPWSPRRASRRLPVVVMRLGCQTSCLQRVSDHSLSVGAWVLGCPIRRRMRGRTVCVSHWAILSHRRPAGTRPRRGHAKLVDGTLRPLPQLLGAEAVDA